MGVALLAPLGLCAQGIAINETGAPPNPFALLDVQGSTADKGVLLPRMSSAQRTAIAGLAAAEEGLTVYDTTTKGYWYWDGAQWVQMAGSGAGWSLTGNAGTVPGTHFLGTLDNVPLEVRVNGERSAWIGTDPAPSTGSNTSWGYQTLQANVSGVACTGIGMRALSLNSTGSYNTAVGMRALDLNISGSENTALGAQSLLSNTIGSGNTAIGATSLFWNILGVQNTAVGQNSMASNTSGSDNTALGSNALFINVTGNSNVAIGRDASLATLSGSDNTACGRWSMRSNVAGSRATAIGSRSMLYANSSAIGFINHNVAVGYEALRGSLTASANVGQWNTAIGYQSMLECTSGEANTAIGAASLSSCTSGSMNVAVGYFALLESSTGSSNTAIGYSSLAVNTVGDQNTSAGAQALFQNTTGSMNSAFGVSALANNSIGNSNTAYGCDALRVNDTGVGNVGVGHRANHWNYNGSNNTIIGSYAGDGVVAHSKSGCVFLGYRAGYFELSSDKLYVENSDSTTPLIYGEFDTDMVRVNHNLGVGCSAFGGGTKVLALENGTPPVAPINGVLLYADEPSSELKVMDEAGNVTTLSPHHFSLMRPSEPMAWSYWSENRALDRRINVDMLRVVRVVERMSGERMVLEATGDGEPLPARSCEGEGELEVLRTELREAQEQIRLLQERVGALEPGTPQDR
ncbi:MAG: hypothetical protein HUU33_09155 [Flavobacteriales bacterium]|nr:hypothetical protein [Flavobacteriales bacterium]